MSADAETIVHLSRALDAQETTAEAALDRCLERIAARNGAINAFITVLDREARTQARDADRDIAAGRRRGPLHGVPISAEGPDRHPRDRHHRGVPGAPASCRPPRCPRSRPSPRGRRGVCRQDEPPRICLRHHERGFGVRARQAPRGPKPLAGRVVGRIGRLGGGRNVLRVDRHRHRRVGPDPGGGLRPRRPEAGARRYLHQGGRPAQHDDRSCRTAVPVGRRCGAPVRRAAGRDRPGAAGASGTADRQARDSARLLSRPARSAGCRGVRRGVRSAARGGCRTRGRGDSARRRHGRDLPAHRARGGGGLSRQDARTAAGTTTRPGFVSGWRWDATSSPKTTRARWRDARSCDARWTTRWRDATGCSSRRWPSRRRGSARRRSRSEAPRNRFAT